MIKDIIGNPIELGSYILYLTGEHIWLGKVLKLAYGSGGKPYLSCVSVQRSWCGWSTSMSVIHRIDKIIVVSELFAREEYSVAYDKIGQYMRY